jgi:hypothetical protein
MYMPTWRPPRANEIDKKLRDDFRRMLREYGITTNETDPILALLFRSLAAQVEAVYQQAADNIPRAVLDELIAGLGMPECGSEAAQTVLRFALKEGRERFEAGAELIGEAASKEKLTFALDTQIEVSPAQISLVAIYHNRLLRLHNGTVLAKEFEDARLSFEAVPADLGPHPAIFMAIDVPDERHLSHHGFYFELTPEAKDLLVCLQREVWCVLDEQGEIRAEGMLRACPGNAGVRNLAWIAVDSTPSVMSAAGLLPEGFYGGRIFIFPEVPVERRFLTNMPKGMDTPLRRIFQAPGARLFARPRAWLRIALPPEVSSVAEDLIRIVLHCTTASNVEVLDQTISFDQVGTSIPISNGGGRVRHLVRPMSIKGERGSAYAHESDPTANAQTGRYRIRQGRVEFEPARTVRGIPDRYANVRLLLSNGTLGNGVGVGAVTTFLRKVTAPMLALSNVTVAAGGTDGESFEDVRRRFAELLLSRERIVTHADLEAVIKAFEPKIREVRCQPGLERTPAGLRRVQKVTAVVDRNTFTSPDEEASMLQRTLEAHLQERAALGLEVRVEIAWT